MKVVIHIELTTLPGELRANDFLIIVSRDSMLLMQPD